MELMTDKDLASVLSVSRRQVWSLQARGGLPEPVYLGRSTRWRVQDISEWVRLGCPSREVFEREKGRVAQCASGIACHKDNRARFARARIGAAGRRMVRLRSVCPSNLLNRRETAAGFTESTTALVFTAHEFGA